MVKFQLKGSRDKQIIKDSVMVLADEIASAIPGLNIAWGLSKALAGAGMKLREQRALEWVEMIRDNTETFTKKILEEESFQDGFVYSIEKYLIERNDEKRRIFRKIFLGFAKSNNLEVFSLEKLTHSLSQLSTLDVEVLKDIKPEAQNQNYQIYGANHNHIENIYSLINLGILLDVTGNRIGMGPEEPPFVKLSTFGKQFIEFIKL